MALDNPVLADPTSRFAPRSRVVELAVVVALSVAVVVVAALWGSGADGRDALSPTSAPTVATTATAPPAAVSDTSAAAAAQTAAPTAAELTAALQQRLAAAEAKPALSAAVEIPSQSGIVPGRPDPLAPTLPSSFERYQVQRGESLFLIASARGVSVAELLRWNWQLDADAVLIRGEWLWIPQWDQSAVADDASEAAGAAEEGSRGRGGG